VNSLAPRSVFSVRSQPCLGFEPTAISARLLRNGLFCHLKKCCKVNLGFESSFIGKQFFRLQDVLQIQGSGPHLPAADVADLIQQQPQGLPDTTPEFCPQLVVVQCRFWFPFSRSRLRRLQILVEDGAQCAHVTSFGLGPSRRPSSKKIPKRFSTVTFKITDWGYFGFLLQKTFTMGVRLPAVVGKRVEVPLTRCPQAHRLIRALSYNRFVDWIAELIALAFGLGMRRR
jgi:hypothetical protein